ncbi:hypothetical protein XELAEV_18021280mg [Xenopus laevis]|uniref:Uncharacterized protein n=1 Tax=Xenopus laevis TaxID=8355 RepID=A0A974D981_XENLA|nr:hypothetical protein XELAEV_18021280mg [Xenopus laevis]
MLPSANYFCKTTGNFFATKKKWYQYTLQISPPCFAKLFGKTGWILSSLLILATWMQNHKGCTGSRIWFGSHLKVIYAD